MTPWEFLQKIQIVSWCIGSLTRLYRWIQRAPKKLPLAEERKVFPRPQRPIPGSRENGKWVFICGEKEYDISKSTYIWGTGSGPTVMHSSHIEEMESIKASSVLFTRVADSSPRCEVYQMKESNIFILIRMECFVGEYSKEDVRGWLNTQGAPREAYQKAGIELQAA